MIFVLVVFFVLIEAVFTALEVALGATPRARWRTLSEEADDAEREAETPDEAARARGIRLKAMSLARLTEFPERLSLLFISITTLALWAAASLLTGHAMDQRWPWWALAAAFVAVLFAAEVLPLLIAAQHGEAVALALARPVSRVLRVVKPVLIIPSVLGTGLGRLLGARPEASTQVTSNELRTALAAAEEEGVIESEERAMLEGAIAFREKPVATVMTPLDEVIAVYEDDDLPTVLGISLEEGHSRLPVLAGSRERVAGDTEGLSGAAHSPLSSTALAPTPVPASSAIRGVLATKDLLRPLRSSALGFMARDAMRVPCLLPADTPIAAALERLRHERTLMAVVTGEEGAVGIVTLEDLLEELVGEIEDEWDDEPALRLEAPADNGTDGTVATVPGYLVVCDRPHEVTIREVERFWRENAEGLLRLRTEEGELAPPDETLDDYVARFLARPLEGLTALVGETRFESEDAAESDETSDSPRAEMMRAIADVLLSVGPVREDRILSVSLSESPRSLDARHPSAGTSSSASSGSKVPQRDGVAAAEVTS